MSFCKRYLLLCLCALVCSTAAHSQNEPVKALSFTTLSWTRMIDNVYYRNADGEAVKMWITNGAPSASYEYRGTLPVRFFEIQGWDAETGEPQEVPVASFAPKTTEDQLLIFIKNSQGRAPKYRVLPLSFDSESILRNSYRFINLSGFPVYVKFGEDRFKLEVGAEESFVTDIPDSGGQGIAMAIQVSDQPGDVKVAYSSSWSMRDGRSSLVFITTQPGDEARIQVKKLYF